MDSFNKLYNFLMEQMMSSTAFGTAPEIGTQGGRVGVSDDVAYAKGDARLPKLIGAKKRKKPPIQRRNLQRTT